MHFWPPKWPQCQRGSTMYKISVIKLTAYYVRVPSRKGSAVLTGVFHIVLWWPSPPSARWGVSRCGISSRWHFWGQLQLREAVSQSCRTEMFRPERPKTLPLHFDRSYLLVATGETFRRWQLGLFLQGQARCILWRPFSANTQQFISVRHNSVKTHKCGFLWKKINF